MLDRKDTRAALSPEDRERREKMWGERYAEDAARDAAITREQIHDELVTTVESLEAEVAILAKERDRYRDALDRIYQQGRGPHVAIAREALKDEARTLVGNFLEHVSGHDGDVMMQDCGLMEEGVERDAD